MADPKVIGRGTVEVDARQARLSASASVRSIWDALVELITNSHDSYGNLGQPTQIKVEAYHGHGDNRFIRVLDRAEGMGPDELRRKISQSGVRHASEGSRGFMGRGAKDIATLGRAGFETIKDGTYSKLVLHRNLEYEVYKPQEATSKQRERLGIRNNGTVVTLWPQDSVTLPRHSTLREWLPRHFALRDIFDSESGNKVVLADVTNQPEAKEKIAYRPPAGEKVFEETFEVDPEDYPGVEARFVVYQAADRLRVPTKGSPYDQAGFLVVDGKAIHELTFFRSSIREEALSRFYFGRLECSHIGRLADQFDRSQEEGKVSDTNPSFILDPDRNEGLAPSHPFTQSLYARPAEVMEELIARHKKEVREEERQIESEELRNRFRELAKLTNDFIREELHESPWGNEDADPKPPAAAPLEFEIVPFGFTIEVGKKKTLTLRAPAPEGSPEAVEVRIAADEEGIELEAEHAVLQYSEERGYLHANIRLLGRDICEAVVIEATTASGDVAEAMGSVKAPREERMKSPLEFARSALTVKLNSPKRLLILARAGLVESAGGQVHVRIKSDDFQVRGQYVELSESDTGHYRGWAKVVGTRSGAEGELVAELGGQEAKCDLAVRDEELPPKGGVSIKLVDKEVGIFRSQFDREDPNILEIFAKHPCISRYLVDEGGGEYGGQDTPHFRLLMAEIVAESVARRVMRDDEDDGSVMRYRDAGQFLYAHQEKFQEFATKAHRIMLSNGEVDALKRDIASGSR